VQTRGAHQIKLATCILFDWIVENNLQWKILICNSVHDELVAEALDEYAEEAKHAVESSMLEAGNHYLTNLTIKADANIGESWGEAK
jgi:DNA polymerase I-like protein with 3'-5' exonuclease and polymerase domains